MNCPRCQTSLLDQRDRDGVTIDVCNRCRGIWLDRGELEKLLGYAARDMDQSGPPPKRRWFETLGDLFD